MLIPDVATWLRPTVGLEAAGIAPSVYTVLAAMALGMALTAVRFLTLDALFQRIGVRPSTLDFKQLEGRMASFSLLIEHHFRFYQFYAHSVLAIMWTYGLARLLGTYPFLGLLTDLAIGLLCVALFAGARDALAKYYSRTNALLS